MRSMLATLLTVLVLSIGWLPADEGNQYYLRAQLQFGF